MTFSTSISFLRSPEELGARVVTPPDPTIINGQEEFEAEEILDYRFYGRKQHQFLVTWKGCGSEADEWVPLRNLENCMDMVTVFKRHHGLIFKREKCNSNTVTPCDPHPNKFILHLAILILVSTWFPVLLLQSLPSRELSRKNIKNSFCSLCTCSSGKVCLLAMHILSSHLHVQTRT